VIHGPQFAAKEHMQALVAEGDEGLYQLASALPQRILLGRHARVAHERAGYPTHVAGSALAGW
jgi:hypothetical protein